MPLSETQARAICHQLLSHVTADDAAVSVSGDRYSHLRFAANTFTTSGVREDSSVSVTVWAGKRKGSASTNEREDASLRAVVERAEQFARLSPEDPEYLPTLGPQRYRPVHGSVEATARVSPAARAREIAEVIATCEKENVIGAGFHEARGSAGASATRNGNFSYERSTMTGLSVTARTPDGSGSGYFARNHYDIARLDPMRIAREAVRKAIQSRTPRALDPGIYTVVLEPQAVADLLGYFAYSFDARGADEGRSPFSAPGGKTRVGERIFDERINVFSDPWHPELPGSQAAQDGLPAQKLFLVRNGVLERLTYSRFWAHQKRKEPTPGPVNSLIQSSIAPVSVEDMIRDTDRGLLITRFFYIREVDPRTMLMTGLTRDGVWLIEKGKIRHAVRNFRFNQSLLELLAPGNVELIGAAERVGSADLVPALKVKQFHFTSPSDAI